MKNMILQIWKDFIPKLSGGEAIVAVVLAAIAQAFGGWNQGMTFLVIAMTIDYISGLIVAAVFHKSKKTETGRLESRAGWKGLIRKGMTLAIVLVAAQLDITLKTTFIRDAIVIGFIANEVISIIENAGLMGVPITPAITNMIDLLKKKADLEAVQIKPADSDQSDHQEGEQGL